MILYSVIPPEIVFRTEIGNEQNKYFETVYLGERVQVAEMGMGRYAISRVFSTSPKAYLNPKLQPGQEIRDPRV